MHIHCTWITSMEHDSSIFWVAVRRITMQMSYIRIHTLQGAKSEPKTGGKETEHSLSYWELWTRNVNPINKQLLTFHHWNLKTTISFSLHIILDNSMSCLYLVSTFHPVWPHKDSHFSPLHATPFINCSPAKGSPYIGFACPDHSHGSDQLLSPHHNHFNTDGKRQHITQEHCYPPTRLQGVTNPKATAWIILSIKTYKCKISGSYSSNAEN